MMIIAVGTTNDAKLRSVLVAIELIMKHKPTFCTNPIIKGIKCNSNVSEQPLSEEETQQGAVNRAKEALRGCTEATFGIGIESGISKIGERWFESGWICVVDRQGNVGLGSSNRYEIREPLLERINNGMELSTAIESITHIKNVKTSLGMSGIITNGIIKRDDSYIHAIIFAFAPFVSDSRLWG